MSDNPLRDSKAKDLFDRIGAKLQGGGRLDMEDGRDLYESRNLLRLGQLADWATSTRQGRKVYYSVNRHINYTNICGLNCRFCSFSRRPGQADGYVMTPAQVAAQAKQALREGASEVHIVGGVHPELPFDYYVEMLERIRQGCRTLHIKAFTAVEISDLARKCRQPVEKTLLTLKEAGLNALPGGGAEILDEDYFERYCPDKPRPRQWLAVHAAAHQMGLPTNATMLYGFAETAEQRLRHMLRLRQLQDRSVRGTGGRFQCFVPLPYVKGPASESTGSDMLTDLKTVAISRLMLDNIPHIKAFWPMLGTKMAQMALCFGADDLDGTVRQYRIVEQQGPQGEGGLDVEEIRGLIAETGRSPTQRDGLYRPVKHVADAGDE